MYIKSVVHYNNVLLNAWLEVGQLQQQYTIPCLKEIADF